MSALTPIRGIAAKDLRNIRRQPSLLATLILGPFVLLSVFAIGFDNDRNVRLDTLFVGEEGDLYSQAIEDYADEIERYVRIEGFTEDVVAARNRLADGDVDIVVVFPSDPAGVVLGGERAVVTVLHNKIDPLQQAAVEIASEVAVQELNAQLVEALVARSQATLEPLLPSFERTLDLARRLDEAAAQGRIDDVAESAALLDVSLRTVRTAVETTRDVATELGADDRTQASLDTFLDDLTDADAGLAAVRAEASDPEAIAERSAALVTVLETLEPEARRLVTLDPNVVARPFRDDSENVLRSGVDDTDFFSPSVTALLLQHLVLTLVALSSVRDEQLGLLPLLRVGPTRPIEVIAAKFAAYTLVGAVIAAGLVITQTVFLGAEVRGSWAMVAAGVGLVVVASIALGTAVAGIARTDSQAVQYSMLLLLAGIFFGGFFLDLGAFDQPALAISWVLPVTPGISWLQDVVIRGIAPSTRDVWMLVAQAAAYALIGWALLARRLSRP